MLRIEEDKHCCRAFIDGEMTIYNATGLQTALMPMIAQPRDLEINLAGVTEIDSAGVQLLMLAKTERDRHQQLLILADHSSAVLDVFELMGLHVWFNDAVVLPGDKGAQHGT